MVLNIPLQNLKESQAAWEAAFVRYLSFHYI